MPLGSSSAAPVTRPGPTRASGCSDSRRFISFRLSMGGGLRLPVAFRYQVMLPRLALQLLAKFRCGNRDQRPRTLGDRLALKIDDSVFGHHIHGVATRRGDDVSRCQRCDDAALARAALVIGGG